MGRFIAATENSLAGGEVADGPKSYQGIMVSSTFTDLAEHRQEVIEKPGFQAGRPRYLVD